MSVIVIARGHAAGMRLTVEGLETVETRSRSHGDDLSRLSLDTSVLWGERRWSESESSGASRVCIKRPQNRSRSLHLNVGRMSGELSIICVTT